MGLPHTFATWPSPATGLMLDENFNYLIEPGDLMRNFGAAWDGLTDDTTPVLNAIAAVYANGGGSVILPPGLGRITSVVYDFAAARTVNIMGCGQLATYVQKIGATTTPLFDISANTAGLLDGTYSTIGEMSLIGTSKVHHGLRATKVARMQTKNLRITVCDVGFEAVGCLIVDHYCPNWNSNNIGYRCRKSGAIYSNLVKFRGGAMRANSTFAFDIGDASGVAIEGTDIEQNGTTSDTATGAIKIRGTVDDETGFSVISLRDVWMEANFGSNFVVDAASGLVLSLDGVKMLGSEGGLAMNVGVINSLIVRGIIAGSVGDTVTSAAVSSSIRGVINTLNHTSTHIDHEVTTGAGHLSERSITRPLLRPAGVVNPASNGDLAIEATSNTSLTFKLKGADGIVRSGSVALS